MNKSIMNSLWIWKKLLQSPNRTLYAQYHIIMILLNKDRVRMVSILYHTLEFHDIALLILDHRPIEDELKQAIEENPTCLYSILLDIV